MYQALAYNTFQRIKNDMNTGYFLVEFEMLSPSDASQWPTYFGIDRLPWRSVDDKYYSGELPSELAALRMQSLNCHVSGLSFGTLTSINEVERLAGTCDMSSKKRRQILAVDYLGTVIEAMSTSVDETCGIGFDAYADGYGSILNLGFVQHPSIFGQFLKKLNENGLFTSLQDLKEYIDHYMRIAVDENLEIIDNAAWIYVYRIVSIQELTSV